MKIVVLAKTKAKREKIEKISDKKYKVFVCQAPQKNQANLRIIKLLARYFGVSKMSIKFFRGHKFKFKIFEIENAKINSQEFIG